MIGKKNVILTINTGLHLLVTLIHLVMVDEPKSSIYGGVVAAPAFRQINKRMISYLNYAPRYDARAVKPPTAAVKFDRNVPLVPDFTGQTIREALTRIGNYSHRVKILGHGRIVAQEPPAGSLIEPGLKFVFKLLRFSRCRFAVKSILKRRLPG